MGHPRNHEVSVWKSWSPEGLETYFGTPRSRLGLGPQCPHFQRQKITNKLSLFGSPAINSSIIRVFQVIVLLTYQLHDVVMWIWQKLQTILRIWTLYGSIIATIQWIRLWISRLNPAKTSSASSSSSSAANDCDTYKKMQPSTSIWHYSAYCWRTYCLRSTTIFPGSSSVS